VDTDSNYFAFSEDSIEKPASAVGAELGVGGYRRRMERLREEDLRRRSDVVGQQRGRVRMRSGPAPGPTSDLRPTLAGPGLASCGRRFLVCLP
jgi:hypothetical protein